MRAALVRELGTVPRFDGFPDPPRTSDGEIVEVVAASIKQLDRAIVGGTHYASPRHLPVIPGTDGIGRLDGELVYFSAERAPYGSMAERSLAAWTVPLPAGLDPSIAAAIVNPALGAWLPLAWRGRLQPGETVLVLGATGATGRLAVAAARLLGAGRVIAAGRRRDVLASLDADAVIDLNLPPAELSRIFAVEVRRGLTLVIDYLWGAPAEALIAATVTKDLAAAEGPSDLRLVSVGGMAAPTITLPSTALRGARLTILGSGTANFPPRAALQAIVREILDHARAGRISIETNDFPLERVAEAWSRTGGDARAVLRP